MTFLSLVVIDITAALARSAISRTERLERAGACGVAIATCCGADCLDLSADFAASAGFGASTGLASATFTGTVFGASASFGASGTGAVAALDATLSGAE